MQLRSDILSFSEKPIGIFDSGLGGLTLVKAIKEKLPYENIVYLGDSLNVPYGDKTPGQITEFAFWNTQFLIEKGVKAVAIACNTADGTARREIQECFTLPLVGVIAPAAEKAASLTRNKKVGVIATQAAVKSGAYERALRSYLADCQVFSAPAPRLVPLIEAGKITSEDSDTVEALREYILPLRDKGIDTLILGCTHYPLILELVKDIVPGMNIVCSGTASIGALTEKLRAAALLNTSGVRGTAEYFVTGDPTEFGRHAGVFLGENIEGKVQKA